MRRQKRRQKRSTVYSRPILKLAGEPGYPQGRGRVFVGLIMFLDMRIVNYTSGSQVLGQFLHVLQLQNWQLGKKIPIQHLGPMPSQRIEIITNMSTVKILPTVIKNGKFSTIILYDDKRVILCHCCILLNFLDFKDLKKLKKTNEGHKGQIKGQNVSNTNSLYFLGIVGFIWRYQTGLLLGLKFQGQKGQKGHQ